MKALVAGVSAMVVVCGVSLLAHEVTYKGTVAAVAATSLQVKVAGSTTTPAPTMVFAVTDQTKVYRGEQIISLKDAHIQPGERVAVTMNHDVPGNVAQDIRLAVHPPSAAAVLQRATPTASLAFVTTPSPAATGKNQFAVTVTGPDGKPVLNADVTVLLVMPAMPTMNMPEMKSSVALTPAAGRAAEAGTYTGDAQITASGRWNVTVSVKTNGKAYAQKKLVLTVR